MLVYEPANRKKFRNKVSYQLRNLAKFNSLPTSPLKNLLKETFLRDMNIFFYQREKVVRYLNFRK